SPLGVEFLRIEPQTHEHVGHALLQILLGPGRPQGLLGHSPEEPYVLVHEALHGALVPGGNALNPCYIGQWVPSSVVSLGPVIHSTPQRGKTLKICSKK